jgi:hypothetical protein
MAKMNRKIESSSVSPKPASTAANESPVALSSPVTPRTSGKVVSIGKTKSCDCLTRQQIEQRAREIWRQKGCPSGQDEKNWLEAEAQLKRELGIV